MATVVWHTVREKLWAPLPALLCLGVVLGSAIPSTVEGSDFSGDVLSGMLPFVAVVLAAGLIGRDVDNGSLHLLLSRPITRSQLLLARVLGVWLVVLATALAGWVLSAGGAFIRGGDVDWATSSAMLTQSVLRGTWWITLLVLFSVLVPGYRDLGLFFGLFVVSELLTAAGENMGASWLLKAGQWLIRQLVSAPNLKSWDMDTSVFAQLLHYASNLTLALAFAFWHFNRREIGYGRD